MKKRVGVHAHLNRKVDGHTPFFSKHAVISSKSEKNCNFRA